MTHEEVKGEYRSSDYDQSCSGNYIWDYPRIAQTYGSTAQSAIDTPQESPRRYEAVANPDHEASDVLDLFLARKTQESYRSLRLIEQLLSERQVLFDAATRDLKNRMMSLFPEYSMANQLRQYNPEARKRFLELAKERADLETRMREERLRLWQDTAPFRRELLDAGTAVRMAQQRRQLAG